MRVATWNVNGMRARLDFLLHWLGKREPDVVGLQELKLTDDQFPHEAIESAGYRALTHGQKSWNGVAVLYRDSGDGGCKAEVTQVGLPGQEDFGARLLTARIAPSGGDALSFTSVYVPNGKTLEHADYPRKLAWLDALAEHFASEHDPAEPSILCGDFNVVPAPLDSWDESRLAGHIFHTDAERERIQKLYRFGFVDVFRAQHPDEPGFSWWDYRGGAFHRGHGLRIDFLLATPPAAARVREAGSDRDYRKKQDGLTASDHAPVTAVLAPNE